MSVDNVRKFFLERNMDDPVFDLDCSGATVDLASKTLGIKPEFIAKTLAFKVKERIILIVTRGNARIDNKKFKQYFKTKAKMLSFDEVEPNVGHPVGGVCPFWINNNGEVFLDESIRNFEYVYPAAGSKNTALKISPGEMQSLTNADWVDISTTAI